MSVHVTQLPVKHLCDDYCAWCERDITEDVDELVMKYHKNSWNEWVAFVMHYRCFQQSRQFEVILDDPQPTI
jgi:wyosine [tRNA(Phe)-imidazoG37] synthetase (radical SAM superfamily)